MRKILYAIPIVFFIVFVLWGFITINSQNTKVLNDYMVSSKSVDYAKMQELGLNFKVFIKDKSDIKIHHETKNEFYIEYKNYEIDLEKSILKPIFINFTDGVDYCLSKVGNGIGYAVKKIESIF